MQMHALIGLRDPHRRQYAKCKRKRSRNASHCDTPTLCLTRSPMQQWRLQAGNTTACAGDPLRGRGALVPVLGHDRHVCHLPLGVKADAQEGDADLLGDCFYLHKQTVLFTVQPFLPLPFLPQPFKYSTVPLVPIIMALYSAEAQHDSALSTPLVVLAPPSDKAPSHTIHTAYAEAPAPLACVR